MTQLPTTRLVTHPLRSSMAQASFHFPRGFLWGCATAAHQVEGNNTNNNWWAWEQRPGRIRDGHKSGLACDWWRGRWKEDFDRAANANQNAHRLSIEWARIQPTPDRWDETAIDRYRDMLRGLHERGMLPMVTLHHFTDPLWFAEKGGWSNPQAIEWFAAYTRKVVEAMKEYVSYWITLNEPNGLAINSYMIGNFPPGEQDLSKTFQVMLNLIQAHGAAYHEIHKIQPTARVSIAHHVRPLLPARSASPLDRLLAGLYNSILNDLFPRALTTGQVRLSAYRKDLPQVKKTLDFLGVNYYTREQIGFTLNPKSAFARRSLPKNVEHSPNHFITHDPPGFGEVLKWANGFRLPMIITENGTEDPEDHLRPRYILEHLHQAWRAVNENFPIKGYFYWTLVDNFEWDEGWNLRFGLWELDVDSQARKKRPSADLYAEICRENGISSDMVARYAPELSGKMFPG